MNELERKQNTAHLADLYRQVEELSKEMERYWFDEPAYRTLSHRRSQVLAEINNIRLRYT